MAGQGWAAHVVPCEAGKGSSKRSDNAHRRDLSVPHTKQASLGSRQCCGATAAGRAHVRFEWISQAFH